MDASIKLMNDPTLHIRIISPQKLILDVYAYAVSSENSKGKFDILPYHANFITLVEDQPIVIRPTEKTDKTHQLSFKFPLAVISVTENTVNIYTNIQL